MAPRKPPSPAKPRRTTRARAADADTTTTAKPASTRKPAKEVAIPTTTRTQAIESKSRVSKKTTTPAATTKPSRGGRATTRAIKTTPATEVEAASHDDADELMLDVTVAKPAVKSSRTTPASTATAGLAAAPRRRVKVTPLTPSEPQPETTPAAPIEEPAQKKSTTRAKKEKAPVEAKQTASTRAKRTAAAAKLNDAAETAKAEPETKKRGRGRAAKPEESKSEANSATKTSTAGKPRGRPKKESVAADPVEMTKPEPVTTRQTRTRAGSVNTSTARDNISVVIPKKKVTFETMPSDEEDEKENKRPRTMAKFKGAAKSSTTSKKTEAPTTGMRARPLRKPATTKTTKATRGASTKTAASLPEEMEVDEPKRMPRALTPKKITQVAKAVVMDSEDEDNDDELASAKTPVRSLSMSPKRGLTPSAARPLSPVKTLDFATALKPASPEPADVESALGILSPARRLPGSPVKDILKESPRRAPEGVTIFRAQMGEANHGAALGLSPPKNQSVLQQSPKRGLGDSIVFPPSAVKSRATPLKNSLLSSPARRLFSATKQKTPAKVTSLAKQVLEQENDTPLTEEVEHEEIQVSSHFRSSVSPQRLARVYRLSEDEVAQDTDKNVDFDDSVLDVRSPLKVKPVVADASMTNTMSGVQQDLQDIIEEDGDVVVADTDVNMHSDEVVEIDNDETIMDPALEADEVSVDDEEVAPNGVSLHEVSAEGEVADQQESATIQSPKKIRLSNGLFSRLRHDEDESEDELAADQTPDNRMLKPNFRPSMSAANIRSRLSAGIAPPSAAKNVGFTPLAAQVQGWRAASPEKRTPAPMLQSREVFSPLARMHVDGAVELGRPDTPGSKRKSLRSRQSLAPSMAESPIKADFFAESMAAQDFEEQVDGHEEVVLQEHEDLHDFVQQDESASASDQDILDQPQRSDQKTEDLDSGDAELTTDLVNLINASDTAMVDFNALAHEADDLAAVLEATEENVPGLGDRDTALDVLEEEQSTHEPALTWSVHEAVTISAVVSEVSPEEEDSTLSTSSGSFTDQNEESINHESTTLAAEATAAQDATNTIASSSEEDAAAFLPTEFTAASIEVSPFKPTANSYTTTTRFEEIDFTVTPVRPDPSIPRQIHTVVSKVPLRPEGEIPADSPIKVQRKRARSMSASTPQPTKRRSLGLPSPLRFSSEVSSFETDVLSTPKANGAFSPQRRARSMAPSPAHSLASGLTTPGQMSFAIDDFGDSTLDGIDMPEDEIMSDEVDEMEGVVEQDESMLTVGSTRFKTPAAKGIRASSIGPSTVQSNASGAATPRYAMSTQSSKSRVEATPRVSPTKTVSKTPLSASARRTPSTGLKSKLGVKTPQTSSRTPLKTVGKGILAGAVVYTDVHTSEGMDASAFYIDTLTSMGARVVKDWRWNARTSTSSDQATDSPSTAAPGITHVVYKDGGKRTLEKLRASNGQVLCVGVAWVLDCLREGTWLDEQEYAVDQSVLPRGGSRRRKSMEPRMLAVNGGSVSGSKERKGRSVSLGVNMSERMAMELSNTPQDGRDNVETEEVASGRGDSLLSEETEISSTYNSPTAATVGGGGDTANVGLLMQEDPLRTPAPASSISRKFTNIDNEISTPQSTSLEVDYDPRTAATPLTPYLVAKGKEVMMSAPAKQSNKGLFENDDEEDGDGSLLTEREKAAQKDTAPGARKFQVKGNHAGRKVIDGRRKTLGSGLAFKPVVGSPLRKE